MHYKMTTSRVYSIIKSHTYHDDGLHHPNIQSMTCMKHRGHDDVPGDKDFSQVQTCM